MPCRSFSSVKMHNTMPYYTGILELCVLRKPVSQLLVGQLKRIRNCSNQEIQQWYRRHNTDPTMIIAKCRRRQDTLIPNEQTVQANVVTTRSERRKYLKGLQKEQEEQQEQTRTRSIPVT